MPSQLSALTLKYVRRRRIKAGAAGRPRRSRARSGTALRNVSSTADRELGAVGEDFRVGRVIAEQPASDEDPFERGGVAAVHEPLDGALRQEVDGGRAIAVLDEPTACRHPAREFAPPRFVERLLKSLEECQAALLSGDAIGIAADLGKIEPQADPHGARIERRAAEPADIELRFPAAAVMKREDVSGRVRVEAVGVKQLRPGLVPGAGGSRRCGRRSPRR